MLGRDRFDQYVSREERDEFLETLIRESDLIEITEPKAGKAVRDAQAATAPFLLGKTRDALDARMALREEQVTCVRSAGFMFPIYI